MKGEKLKAKLKERGMTQNEFAEKLGTDKANVSKMMKGETNFTEKTIRKICEILSIEPNEIID